MSSHNNSAVAPTQHSSAVTPKTDHAKRVKRFGPQEVTPEMVAKLKRSVKATKKQSCLASIMHPDPRITDLDREHNEVIRREYNLIKSSYIRQQTRRGYGCVGYVPKGRCEVIGGKIRQFFLATCEHPRFDQFIMVCILVNCVFLALTDPTVETEPQYQEYAGYVFLFIFTVECMCKLIALSSLYFDDYWNWLDVVVVIEGWVSFISAGGGYLSGLKTLRILRPLRVANRLPALKKVITALLGSLPAIFNTFVVFFFFLLIFAMLCVMLWNGTFHYRCKNIETLEWVDEEALCYPAQPRADAMFCRSLQFLDSPYTCEDGERCEAYTATPENGDLNFDNLGYSLLTLFAVSTMEGWSDVLFYTQDVMTQGTFFVFLAIILIGNFTIVNLMIAAILVQLDGAAELEEREAVAAELAAAEEEEMALIEAEEARKKLIANAQEDARRRSVQGQKSVSIEIPPPVTSASLKRGRNNSHLLDLFCDTSSHILMNVCYQGIPSNLGPDHWTTKLRWIFLEDASPFSNFIQGCILFNLGVLAMDSHGITKSTATFLSRANLSLTGIFCFEMVAKLFTGGIPGYVSSKWNLFDGFIVIGSVLELAMASGASSLGALRVVRMLRLTRVARLARLANKWKSLQGVLSLMVKSSSGMGPVLLLLVLFMFIFSILGMQMFGASVTTDDYIKFDSFLVAFVQCFFVIIGEAWVQIMYVTMADTNPISSIYFVLLIVIGSFILVNLILAVVLGDSMPNKIQMEVGLKRIDIIINGYSLKCSISKWKWYTNGKRIQEARLDCILQWKVGRTKHGTELIYQYSSHLGIGEHLLDEIRYYIDLPEPKEDVIVRPIEDQLAPPLHRRRSSIISMLPTRVPLIGTHSSSSNNNSYGNGGGGGSEGGSGKTLSTRTRRSGGDDIPLMNIEEFNDGTDPMAGNSGVKTNGGAPSEDVLDIDLDKIGEDMKNDVDDEEEVKEVDIVKKVVKRPSKGIEMVETDIQNKKENETQNSNTDENDTPTTTSATTTTATTDLSNNFERRNSDQENENQKAMFMLLAAMSGDEDELILDEGTWEALENAYQIVDNFIEHSEVHDYESLQQQVGPGLISDYKEELFELFSNCTHGFTLIQKIELGLVTATSRGGLRSSIRSSVNRSNSYDETKGGAGRGRRRSSNAGAGIRKGSIASTQNAARQRGGGGSFASGGGGGIKSRKSFVENNQHLLTPHCDTDMIGKEAKKKRRSSIDMISAPLPKTADDARRALFGSFNENKTALITPRMDEPMGEPAGPSSSEIIAEESSFDARESGDYEEDNNLDNNNHFKEDIGRSSLISSTSAPHDDGQLSTSKLSSNSSSITMRDEQHDEKLQNLGVSGQFELENNHEDDIGHSSGGGGGDPSTTPSPRQKDSTSPTSSVKGSFDYKASHMDRFLTSHVSVHANEIIVESKWELKWRKYREGCKKIFDMPEWRDMILAAIIISSGIMLFTNEKTPYLSFWFILDCICGLIFVVEVCVMVGVVESKSHPSSLVSSSLIRPTKHHSNHGHVPYLRTGLFVYLEDPWNKLDVSIVIVTFLGPILLETNILWGYGICQVIRSFRPLRIINRVDSLKYTVQTLYMSLMRLGTLILFLGFSMTAYAVVGMQLLKGLYYYCEDGDMADDEIYQSTVGPFPEFANRYGKIIGENKQTFNDNDISSQLYLTRPCEGVYTNMNGTELEALGKWRNPTFHFDDFPNSFLSVFVLSTEGWAEIVWVGLSTTNVDYSQSPYYNTNILILWYFFFGVSFFALYMINLFIGVVFDLYIEMKNLEDDGKFKKREERSWAEYLSRLQQVKCLKKIPLPSTKWRMKIESFVTTDKFSKFIIGVIILNAITLVVIHRGQSEAFTNTLEWINVALAMIFVLEAILKLIGHGFTAYFSDSVDVFDFVVSVVSMIDSLLFITQTCAKSDSAFLRLVRSMRVFRLLRLVNLFRGCEDILLACKFALPKLIMVCSLLLILVFFFANIGWVLFHDFQEHGNSFSNFRTVFGAMQLLFVIMTGDAWTDTMGELVDDKPHFKIVVVIYFISYLIVQYFVVVNLFVMVVCEAFEVLSEGNRTAVERVLPVFQKVWTDYDPEATGFIHESELETLLRQIPEPIGVSFQATYTRLRTKADFLRMSLVKDKAPFTEVLTGLVAIWLTEEGQAVDTEIANQMNQLSASIVINAATRRWIQKREIRLKKIKLNEEMETEKMKREDNRFTLLLKKATNLALIGVSGKKHLEPLSKTPTLLPTTPLVDPLGVLPSSTSSSFSNKVNYNNIPSLIGGSLDNGIIPNNTTNSIEPSPSVSKDIENNSFSASSAASGSNSKSSLVSKGSWMTGSAKTSSALYSKGVRVAPLTHNSQEAPATQLPALKDTAAKTNNHHTIEVLDHNDENRKKNIIKDGKEETQEPVLASSIKNPKEETKEYVRSESPIDNALTSFIDPTAKTQKM
mmetsp:Transcript_1005/g.1224  ORF Transcript_1005/g.1224 Transcript_1005/m.1224 type:complete len:2440 (-) Transcript_1005:185-7504(-)